MNCFQAKANQVEHQWFVIDANNQVVGRLAAQIAPILMGKHRPTYTPHIDTGDFVIVTNVDKVVYTGKKWEQKVYQRYSGYPGGQKEEVAWKLFARRPERILHEAIRRMMPKSKMGRHMMAKLKLYVGDGHPHQAQQPTPLDAKVGRPIASGIIYAPEQVVNPPRSRRKRKEQLAVDVPETTADAPILDASAPPVEASATAPTLDTPGLPVETQAIQDAPVYASGEDVEDVVVGTESEEAPTPAEEAPTAEPPADDEKPTQV